MKKIANHRIRVVIGLIAIAVALGVILVRYRGSGLPAPLAKPAFDGDSRDLKASEVVATLDAPIHKNMNAIWCASFLSAWKSLEGDFAKEPLSLQGSPEVAMALNKAADPRAHIPTSCLYVAAGSNNNGIIDQIREDLSQRFPTKAQPAFPGIQPNSIVAYAYLEANAKFSLPYFQNREPLVFTDGAGTTTELSSFGVRVQDEYAYFALRRKPAILFEAKNDQQELECVVDLDRTTQPNQIVLALMDQKPTLAEMLASVEAKVATAEKREAQDGLGPNDVLLVPDMVFRMTHRFAEIEGQEFTDAKLKGQRIDVAQQDIQFHLDRSGAELRSESKTYMKPIPTYYTFNRPFLLYMKKRGAEMPYFVMWIASPELLNKWQPPGKP